MYALLPAQWDSGLFRRIAVTFQQISGRGVRAIFLMTVAALALCHCMDLPYPTTLAVGLRFPTAVALDSFGNLYVCEFSASRVLMIHNSGERTVFAEGIRGVSGVAVDADNNIYVSALHENSVYRYTPDGQRLVLADDLKGPAGISLDRQGNLLVAESGSGRILEFNPAGERRVLVSDLTTPTSAVRQGECIFASCRNGLLQCCPDRDPIALLRGGNPHHAALAAACDGTLWAVESDGGGVYAIHARRGMLPVRLYLDGVTAAVCDRDGNLFVATLDGSIHRVDMVSRAEMVLSTWQEHEYERRRKHEM